MLKFWCNYFEIIFIGIDSTSSLYPEIDYRDYYESWRIYSWEISSRSLNKTSKCIITVNVVEVQIQLDEFRLEFLAIFCSSKTDKINLSWLLKTDESIRNNPVAKSVSCAGDGRKDCPSSRGFSFLFKHS